MEQDQADDPLSPSWNSAQSPVSPRNSGFRLLTAPIDSAIEWSVYAGVVESIVTLLGDSRQAVDWGQTVTEPFASVWNQETAHTQQALHRRLEDVQGRISRLAERERHAVRFLYCGQIVRFSPLAHNLYHVLTD